VTPRHDRHRPRRVDDHAFTRAARHRFSDSRQSSIDLGAPSVNATVAIEVPAALAPLRGWTSAPPSAVVLFWSLFLVLLVVGAALGRVWWDHRQAIWHWMLLAIAPSQRSA
jgi:hypothetical protein